MLWDFVLILLGFVFLIKGADLLVRAATSIAKKFGLSELLIGLTIVAVGTSLPEIFITITSAVDGHSDLIIGNAVGSCICNFLFVIGLTSLFRPIKLDKRIVNRHLPIGIIVMILLLFFGNTNQLGDVHVITRGQGAFLILCIILYIIYTIFEEQQLKNKKIDQEIINDVKDKDKYATRTIIIYMILGILGLKFGSDFVVDHSLEIARTFGLSEQFLGMTIIAVGTALPEIITGIIVARKNETDLLIGNISGSNILNLCLLIGLGAMIQPLTFSTEFNSSILILIATTVFLQLVATMSEKNELDKKRGILLIVVYFIYLFSIA